MFQFGSGLLFLNPVGGNEATNPTPVRPLTLQDISLDISIDLKELRGQSQAPDDVAPGDMKITGKFSFANQKLDLLNQIMFANTRVTGGTALVAGETGAIPGSSTYTVTVTNSATFSIDLGVLYATTGKGFERILSGSPAVGQYTVSAGIYTFASADAGLGVLISYTHTNSTVGYSYQMQNHLMGYGPVFEMYLGSPYQSVSGIPNLIHLYACRAAKATLGNKRADYTMIDVDYTAYANAGGFWGEILQVAA